MKSSPRILYFLYFLFGLIIPRSHAQQYNFENYSVAEGLAQSQVHALLEDSRSYIWMGTQGGGLCRFDGLQFETFEVKDGLSGNYVEALLEDKHGNIWIGTQKGLTRFDGHQFESFFIDKKTAIGVYGLLEDKNGQLWVGTSEGIYHFREMTQSFSPYSLEMRLPRTRVNCLLEGRAGIIWIGHERGLIKIEENKATRFDASTSWKNHNVKALLERRRGQLFIGTAGAGAFVFDGKKFDSLRDDPGIPGYQINCLHLDKSNRLWLGSADQGITIWDRTKNDLNDLTEVDGLGKDDVRNIIEDNWGNVWIATSGGGVSKYAGRQFQHFTTRNGLYENEISALTVDGENRLWVGTERGVAFYNYSDFQHFAKAQGFTNNMCTGIVNSGDGTTWLATDGDGLARLDTSGFRFYKAADGLGSNRISSIQQDASGNLWLGTAANGITKMSLPSPDTLNFTDSLYFDSGIVIIHLPIYRRITGQDGLPDLRITCMNIDSRNRIWAGTRSGGIAIFEDSLLLRVINQQNGLSDNNISCITEDESGLMWVGTASGGVVSILIGEDSLQINAINQSDGLASNKVNLIGFDESQNMWVGSHLGVDKIQLDAERKLKSIQHFGIAEGFSGVETTLNAFARDSSDNLWFGTTNGLMQYIEGAGKKNKTAPSLHIRDVQLGYTSLREGDYSDWLTSWGQLKDGLTLPYKDNDLNFEFIAINLNNPTSVRYQVLLENFDTDWSPPLKANSKRYQLPPGDYTFKVRSLNEDGVYNDPPIAMSFSITPPYWQTMWFRIGSVLLGLFLIFGFIRLRVNRIRKAAKEEREKLEMEKHLIELEQKALQLQMNPHFIFNALNSIQGLIVKKEPIKARFQLAKFSKLMRSILENSRSELISLEREIELLENYLTVENNSRSHPFTYKIEVDERLDTEAVQIPPMMIQPFVENAIIHGIATVEEGHIKINFSPKGKLLECIIEDNGIGLSEAKKRKSQMEQQHKSAALEVTRERLAILQKDILGKEKGLEIKELKNIDGSVKGTRVVLRVPLNFTT